MGILVIRRNSACGVALPMSAIAFGAGDFVRLAGRSVQLTANLHPRVPEGLQRADTGLPTAPTCSASAKAPIETTIAIHRPGTDRLFRSSGSAFSAQKGHQVGVLRIISVLGQPFSVTRKRRGILSRDRRSKGRARRRSSGARRRPIGHFGPDQ